MKQSFRFFAILGIAFVLAALLVLEPAYWQVLAGQEATAATVEDPALLTQAAAQLGATAVSPTVVTLINQGRNIFRFETFGDEDFWGASLRLHQAIAGAANGGVGPGLTPKAALDLGLKVDSDALTPQQIAGIRNGTLNLNSVAVTLQLLQANAIVGVTGFFNAANNLRSIGIQCALCHSVVDNSVAPGVGVRLDGWANRDLNIGAIVALAPNLIPFVNLLGVPVPEVKRVLNSWGPGKFDAALMLDGKAFRPDGSTAAVLIPPAFGLAGVNLHTSVGWGSVTYWNAFVANLPMHGKGTFFDPRLNDPVQFPIAARERFFDVRNKPDLVTSKLARLHLYQMTLTAPPPPPGSFDPVAAARGKIIFNGKGRCDVCHVQPLLTEPGWNMHTPEELGVDPFHANRSPDRRYRTAPLKGLWTHRKGGFLHDGSAKNLNVLINVLNNNLALGLTPAERLDLIQYLLSI